MVYLGQSFTGLSIILYFFQVKDKPSAKLCYFF